MIKRSISRVFIIIVAIALLQISGTILLARNMSKDDIGLYRLILTIIDLGGIFCLFGIDHAFVRFFSSSNISFEEYDWKGFLKKLSVFSIISLTLGISIVGQIYKFSFFSIISIMAATSMLAVILIFTACMRAQQKYELSIFLGRMHFILFFLLILILMISKHLSLKNLITSFLISLFISSIVTTVYWFKKNRSGKMAIPFSVIKNGFYYFGLGISVILLLQVNYLFIGKMLSYRDLAVYVIIASLMRIFEFIQDAAYYVLAPHLNKNTALSIRKIFLRLLGIGLLTAIFYCFFGQPLIHILFKGRYDEGYYLLPFFIAIGVLRILYVVPASIIGGRSSETTLRNQFCIAMAAVILNIVLTYFFIKSWGLTGAALASLSTWIILFLMTFIGTKRYIIYEETDFVAITSNP